MVTPSIVRTIALAFDEAVERPHFENTSFRIKTKVFATMNVKESRLCVKLSITDQSVFCAFDRSVIYPVPNAWGKNGWTFVNLKKVRKSMLLDALTTSYCNVAPQKLRTKYMNL